MPYLKSSEGLGIKPQRITMGLDTRTAAAAGTGALRLSSGDLLQLSDGSDWADVSQDPSYTTGGNFIGDGSDG
jgi:hypothetical protein